MRNRRRRYIVNKPLQKRIIFTISFVPIMGLIGATLAVAILAGQVLDEARSIGENIPTLGPLFIALLLFILSAGGIVVLQALRYSNRIAGPMYRLIKSMEQVREGDYNFHIKLRDGDELMDLATAMNKLIDWLREHPPAGIEPKKIEETEEEGAEKKPEMAAIKEEPESVGAKSD